MGNYTFVDIEDFQNAYKERLKTYRELEKQYEGHEIILMHLGGIIIECFLKDLIVRKHKITKRIGVKIWNTDQQVLQINANHQLSKKNIVKENLGINNPEHNLIEAYKKLDEIKDLIASNEDLGRRFEYINNPLKKQGSSFIDLRYSTKSDFNNIEEEFELWKNDFKEILVWLANNSRIIEV